MTDPYFSELRYRATPNNDFIEITVDAGTDVSDLVVTVYNGGGSVRSTNLVDGIVPTTAFGKDIYVINTTSSASFKGLGSNNAVSLSDSSGVLSFLSFEQSVTANAGPAAGMTTTGPQILGQTNNSSSFESTDEGATYSTQPAPNPGSIPCLANGTAVLTEFGEQLVEDVQPGTRLITVDGRRSEMVTVLSRTVTQRDLRHNPKLYPVRISAGSLGHGLPKRDLLVSRQHRMMVCSPIVERMFGVTEVLVPAIKLTEIPGIYVDRSVDSVTYYHLLFTQHEVILAEGAPTESLLLGEEAMKSMPPDSRIEIETLFPGHLQSSPSKPLPDRRRVKKLVQRHAANERAVLASYRAVGPAA